VTRQDLAAARSAQIALLALVCVVVGSGIVGTFFPLLSLGLLAIVVGVAQYGSG
jgi:hypothetical protein